MGLRKALCEPPLSIEKLGTSTCFVRRADCIVTSVFNYFHCHKSSPICLCIIQLCCLLNEDRVCRFQAILCIKTDDHKTILKMLFAQRRATKTKRGARQLAGLLNAFQSWLWYAKLAQRTKEKHKETTTTVGKRVLLLYVTHWPNFYQPCGINQVFLDGCNRCRWLFSCLKSAC